MDVDLCKVRHFVVVAEELHFGRAAGRLHITQPVLSGQIRALEQELRAQLFTRNKQTTELTPAGRQLLEDARPMGQPLGGHGLLVFTAVAVILVTLTPWARPCPR